tara:strand:- start:8869 stop:9309 length:441 start_codon:yes stop_codon:yes gene_type:complete
MPNFNTVLYESIVESLHNLQRIKIKIDPAQWKPGCDIRELDEYTGYILQEFEDGSVQVFVPDEGLSNPIMSIGPGQIADEEGDPYRYLKELICKALPSKGGGEDKAQEISEADCIHTIVDTMKFNNFSESEVIDILKEFISETKSI